MRYYYHMACSDKPSNTIIIRAMRKYGLDNFFLGIKEFCVPQDCIKLEQKWIDHYKPKALPSPHASRAGLYNILDIAGNSLGFKHSPSTIKKLREAFSKENHPKFGSNSSIETRKAISEGIKKYYSKKSHKYKGLKGKLAPQYGLGGKAVYCYNKTGENISFPSINGAKQHFKVRWSTIKNNIDTHNWVIINGQEWLFKSCPQNS